MFSALQIQSLKPIVSIKGGEDFISSMWDTLRVHNVDFHEDEAVLSLFSAAQNFKHVVFEEWEFENEFLTKHDWTLNADLWSVSFIGPQIPLKKTPEFVQNVIIR